jgi:DNA primase
MTRPADKEAVRAGITVRELCERYGATLRPAGRRLRGPCVLCQGGQRPPFVVTPDRERWQCHHCGERGDVIDLYQRLERLPFSAACEQLAAIAGVSGPLDSAALAERQRRQAQERERAERMARTAAELARQMWARLDPRHPRGLAYLAERKVAGAAGRVRFHKRSGDVALPLYDASGTLCNLATRSLPPAKRLCSVSHAPARAAMGDVADLGRPAPVVIAEGLFDYLSAAVLWPGALILGAHGAALMPVAAELARDAGALSPGRGLTLIAQGDKAGRGAVRAALDVLPALDHVRVAALPDGCDLNDWLCSRGTAPPVRPVRVDLVRGGAA